MENTNKFYVPSFEIESRIAIIQKKLQQNGIDGLLVIQRADLFYFSGSAQNGPLYIPAEGDPLWGVKKYHPRAVSESPLQHIIEIKSIREMPGLIREFYDHYPSVLGYELDVLPVNVFQFLKKLFDTRESADASDLILATRMIKSDWEIEQLKNAADLSKQTFEYAQTVIRTGLSEMGFAGLLETFARRWGHEGMLRDRNFQPGAYPWHILSGPNGGKVGVLEAPASGQGMSAAFPCGASLRKIRPNEPIMIDFGTVLNGFHIDETRMFAIGSMPDDARRACEAAIEIHDHVLQKAKPGMPADELFEMTIWQADALGYADAFLGPPGYKVSFVGHGIGHELVEPPFIAKNRPDRLKPGVVFAIEPKMVFPGKFAAGIESVFQVTPQKVQLLSMTPAKVFYA